MLENYLPILIFLTLGILVGAGAMAAGFVLGVPEPDTATAQLDAYAGDVTTVLATEPPRHGGATRLSEVAKSPASFQRERDALERRVDRILPDNLLFRIRTPYGDVGYARPAGVPVGVVRVATAHGEVTIWVWYV